jgi:hypothetical protein
MLMRTGLLGSVTSSTLSEVPWLRWWQKLRLNLLSVVLRKRLSHPVPPSLERGVVANDCL